MCLRDASIARARLTPWLAGLLGVTGLIFLGAALSNRRLKRELERHESKRLADTGRLRAVETVARVGNWSYDVGRASFEWSDEAYRIVGMVPGARAPTCEWLSGRIVPEDRERQARFLKRLLESRPGEWIPELRWRVVMPNGEIRTVRVCAEVVYDEAGMPRTLIGTIQDISERARIEADVAALSRLYRVLSGINKTIVRRRNPEALFDEACRIAVETGEFRMAWIAVVEADGRRMTPRAWAGCVEGYLDAVFGSDDDTASSHEPADTSLRTGRHAVCNDIAAEADDTPWRQAALQRGYRSSAAFPIRANGEMRAVLALYADAAGFFDQDEIELLVELARDIGFALEFVEVDSARETLAGRMMNLLENMSDGFVSLDRDGRYRYVNRRAGELLESEPTRLTGKPVGGELPDAIRQTLERSGTRAPHSGETSRLEHEHAPTGQWYEVRLYHTQDGISIFLTDITERKKSEDELKRLHSVLNALVAGSTDAIFVKDREGRYLLGNEALARLIGRASEDIAGKNDFDLFPAESARRHVANDHRIIDEMRTDTYEEMLATPEGHASFLTTKGPLIIDGEVCGVFGIARDITARKETEAALVESEARFSATFEQAAVGLALVSPEGHWLQVNRKLCDIVGYSEAELLDLTFQDITHPDDLTTDLDQVQRMLAREITTYSMEKRYLRKNGSPIWVNLTVSLVFNTAHQPEYFVSVIEDIGARKAVEAALSEREAHYRLLFERNPAPMLVYERGSLDMLAVNQAFCEHYGYSEEEALKLKLTDLYPDIEKQAIADVAARIHGFAYVGEWHHLKRDGSRITIEARSHDIDFEGHHARVAVITDITERKQAELAIQQSEARYRALIEMAPFPAAITRMRDGIIVYGNHRAEAQYGIGREQGIGRPAEGFYQDADQRRRFLEILQKNGTVSDLEVRMLTADGRPFWALVSASIVEFDNEPAIFTAINDITVRKQTEIALREQEAFFRLITENIGDMVAVLDLQGRWLYVSPSYEPLFGPADALRGSDSFSAVHPEDRARVRAIFEEAVRTGKAHRVNFRYVLRDGSVRQIESQRGVIRNAEGTVERVVVVSRDVTERTLLENEIRRFNSELEERVRQRTADLAAANKELETFTYTVSHDLKAPLRGIDGYSRLLLEDYQDSLGEAGRQLVENVRRGVAQMSQLIEDLLDYSRMERRSLSGRPLELGPLVEAVLADRRADIDARGMIIETEVKDLIPRADPEGLTIVIRNLVDNAIKFTRDSRPPRLSITGQSQDKSVILKFADNGIGFDMQFHHRIFEIFQRLQRAEEYAGTGIGLAIVQKAMQRMGGRVWAESAPGNGACFYLELPR